MSERWVCPSCKQEITVNVRLLEPPRCTNKHIKGGYVMVLQQSETAPMLSNEKEV